MPDRKQRGQKGEAEAEKMYRDKGYEVIVRNYSCRFGEIDLIVKKDGRLVFAEVKARASAAFAHPREFVTAEKQRKIINTACIYLKEKNLKLPIRFDVVEVLFDSGFEKVTAVKLLENAFSSRR